MNYRQAQEKDIPGMVRLLGLLFSVEPDFQFVPEVHEKALKMLIDRSGDETLALVATEDGNDVIRGMMTLQTVVSTATGTLSGWVEDVVMDPDFRGKGIGTTLLERAEEWAVSKGITRLQLLADRDNAKALVFYESRGWKSTNMIPRKKMICS